ncbi:hypothetical protein [Virgibacillus sediminis]|uniref:General stress protein 17M-like domain-containing protein n=1 Tax=Virgibacillus sediminis TaxID=202260 RepID=A0ABV7A7E3_9BACI
MKPIQAYFKSENDAEAARTALQRLKTEHVMVDSIPNDQKQARLIPLNNPGAGAGTVGFMGRAEAEMLQGDDQTSITHVLEGEVGEQEYEQATEILKQHNGYDLEK